MAVALVHTLKSTTNEIQNAFGNKYTITDTIKEIQKGNPLFECITNDMLVKPYFDWDADFETENEMEAFKEPVWDSVKDDLIKLGFDLVDDVIYFAERFGFNPVKSKYKVSYRAFVQDFKMTPKHVKLLITQTNGLSKYIDSAPYMSNQRLNMINTCKGEGDQRVFKEKFPSVRDSFEYYIVSNVKDTDKIRTVEMVKPKDKKESSNCIEKVPFETLQKVVMGLPIERFESYDDWFKIICAIVNTGAENGYERKATNLAHSWSEQSVKYDENSLDKFISSVANYEKITYATLCYHLKNYNNDLFKELCAKKQTYENVKVEFERECFKIKYNGEYGVYRNDKLEIYNRTRFTEVFCELIYEGEDAKGNKKDKPFLKTWFDDADKRFYDYVDFLPPPQVCNDNTFNLWNGLAIDKSDELLSIDCDEILELINVLCNHHQDSIEYILNWLADIVQNPGKKCGTAVVLKSKQGAGKGTLIEIMRKILGDYVGETSNPQQDVFGNHGNIHIGKLLVSLDEIGNSDTNKVLGRLKNIITSNKCIYNEKGIKQTEVNNNCRFIFTTNKSIPISLDGADDRRYCLLEASNEYCKDNAFWQNFYTNNVQNMDKIKAFYSFLKQRDLTGVNWMAFPKTDLRNDIIQATLHPIVYWFDEYIRGTDFLNSATQCVNTASLFANYKKYCLDHNITANANIKSFGICFKDVIDIDKCGIKKKKVRGNRLFVINREEVFEWLLDNEYTSYESLNKHEFNEEIIDED